MLVAQEKFLRLCQEDVGEPLESQLVIHYLPNVELPLELVVNMLVRFNPFISLTKEFVVAKFLGQGNFGHLCDPRGF